jgi:Flp pilus assembly pilin Flp
MSMTNLLTRFLREEDGQDLVEYALLAIFIALMVTVGLKAVAEGINVGYSNLGTQVSAGS